MKEMTVERWQDPEAPDKKGLNLAGRVTVDQAAQLKQVLLETLGDSSELQVNLAGVTEMDFAGLQLLCAAHLSARAFGKRFIVNDGGSKAYLDAVAEAGFPNFAGCGPDDTGACLWGGGGT